MSAGQNHQSFRILARGSSEHRPGLQHYLAQIIHDLTFVLFAAIHFTKSPFFIKVETKIPFSISTLFIVFNPYDQIGNFLIDDLYSICFD